MEGCPLSTRRFRRTAAVAVSLTVAVLALTGCGPDKPHVVNGTGGPDGTGATAGATIDPNVKLGDPLTAADVPTWAEADLPGDAADGIVHPCDAPSGARDQQSAVRAAAMTTPTGITVLNQIADYDANDPSAVVTGTITSALVSCPSFSAGSQSVTTRLLASTKSSTAVGAEIVRTNTETGLRDITVYWAEVTGKGTVEVAVSATLGAAGESPLQSFALDVLTAAQLKATGRDVPQVPAPTLPEVRTAAQEEAARLEQEQRNGQVAGDGGIAGDAELIDEGTADEITEQLPSDWQNTTPKGGYTGGLGEQGPEADSGNE